MSSELLFGSYLYIGANFWLQKSSSLQHIIAFGFRWGTKFPLHCIKPDSSGGRHPNVLQNQNQNEI